VRLCLVLVTGDSTGNVRYCESHCHGSGRGGGDDLGIRRGEIVRGGTEFSHPLLRWHSHWITISS